MKKYIRYIIPSMITFVILAIIYCFNNLYPFGSKPLVQVDADYIYIPVLYKIWDFLHGTGNLFYTDLGLGNSLYASLIIQGSLFSPLNLLLYLTSRDNIVNFFGLFIIIKLCLVSLTSYIYIEKSYKINYFYKVLFSILYTFNGFILLNYFNEIWLDIVILFPLLVLYLNKLLRDGNTLGYIIVLSLCFIITFYFSYFIVIFILLYAFIYLNLYKKEKVKETIFKLGISTVIAFLISAFSSVPLMYQILKSARFNFDTYTNMFSNIAMKSLYLLFSPLLIIMFIKLLTKFKKDKVNIYGYFILAMLYIIPVIIDPINALLHGGSYWCFPYRYGFVASFIIMDMALYYISKYNKKDDSKPYIIDALFSSIIVMLGIVGILLDSSYRRDIINSGILLEISNTSYLHIIYMVAIVFVMYIVMLFIKNKWFKYIFMGAISLYSIFLFSTWTIYYNSGYFLCVNAQNVNSNMKFNNDGRYKVEYDVHTPYYGMIFNVSALDNWLHIAPEKAINTYGDLGYHTSDTSVYSYGGTIFTDYLLNFRYVLSRDDKIADDMYSLVDSYNGKYLYEYNYSNNYGVIFDEIKDISNGDRFDYQNNLYKNLYNTDNNIIDYSEYECDDQKGLLVEYNIEDIEYLYFYSDYYDNIDYMMINDEKIYDIDNYIKYLGSYDDDINIEIYLKAEKYFNFVIGTIKKKDILNLSSQVEYKDNKYYIDVDSEKYLFLPINNIPGLYVYNNDKEVETYSYLDNFVCIKLNKGNNVIEVKYKLPLFNIGVVLSIIGIVLLFLYKKIVPNKFILNVSYWAFTLLVIAVFLYYYFYSLFKYVI